MESWAFVRLRRSGNEEFGWVARRPAEQVIGLFETRRVASDHREVAGPNLELLAEGQISIRVEMSSSRPRVLLARD